MYELLRNQLVPSALFFSQFCEGYVTAPTAPVELITVALSVIRTRSRPGFGSSSRTPHWYEVLPRPASSSSLFVNGFVQRIVCTRCGLNSPWPSASGAVVAPGEPLKFAVPEHVRHTGCSSHENVNLFFDDACHVMRGV